MIRSLIDYWINMNQAAGYAPPTTEVAGIRYPCAPAGLECQRDGMSKLPSHPFLTADLEQASFGWPTLAENSFCSSNTVYKRIQSYSQIRWRLIWLQMAFGH